MHNLESERSEDKGGNVMKYDEHSSWRLDAAPHRPRRTWKLWIRVSCSGTGAVFVKSDELLEFVLDTQNIQAIAEMIIVCFKSFVPGKWMDGDLRGSGLACCLDAPSSTNPALRRSRPITRPASIGLHAVRNGFFGLDKALGWNQKSSSIESQGMMGMYVPCPIWVGGRM